MLTVGLVGLVGMGGVLPPGDVAVCGWPRGSLWPSGGPGAGGVGSFGTPGGCLGVVGWRCRWAVCLVSAGALVPLPGHCGLLVCRWGLFGCCWVLLGAMGQSWGRCGVIVGGGWWLVVVARCEGVVTQHHTIVTWYCGNLA